jgi:hypothetical protein
MGWVEAMLEKTKIACRILVPEVSLKLARWKIEKGR